MLDELLDEPEALRRILRATADALPLPRPKPAKKTGKAKGKAGKAKVVRP